MTVVPAETRQELPQTVSSAGLSLPSAEDVHDGKTSVAGHPDDGDKPTVVTDDSENEKSDNGAILETRRVEPDRIIRANHKESFSHTSAVNGFGKQTVQLYTVRTSTDDPVRSHNE